MSTDAQPADSSSAAATPAPVSGQALLDSFTTEERSTWEKSGSLPDRVTVTTADAQPASSPASSGSQETETQAASTDATSTAASEPAKPKGDKLKARNAQLDAENDALREKLRIRHALREELAALDQAKPKADATADSSPAAGLTKGEWQRYMALPGAPKEDDFASYGEFTAAQALFIADQRFAERDTQAREQGAERERQGSVRRMAREATARVQEYLKTDPAFMDKVDERLLAIPPVSVLKPGQPIRPQNVLAQEVAQSPFTPQLLLHFSTDEGRADWGRMLALPPGDLHRAFGRLEARFDRPDGLPSPQKQVSTAPSPATVLGSRPADTADPIEKAVREKDVERYIREANKAELAALHR